MSNFPELITIVIPVKNEERNFPGCLENVRAFEHVVVVDSGSTDRTLEIAAEFGREVVQFKWNGEFPKKRNWVLRNYKFQTPWVMFLDADERITPAFCAEAEKTLAETKCNAFICYYDNWFMDRMLRHGDVMHKTAILRLGTGEYEKIDEEGNPLNVYVSGPDAVNRKKMYRYDYIGQLTMMYSAKVFGLSGPASTPS